MPRKSAYSPGEWAEIQEARRTNRNRQILHRLSNGETVEEIARAMHYSPHSIRWWIKWLYLETNTRNRAHLVGDAFRRGLLPLGDES